ncbi:MAG: hypothetical protein UX47_C0011G0010 [Candidatus Collierbacteria bacterium GW2011_GWA2_46_26]|uniref:Uncharacterized protein n=1 Tax=Candidatus Collierbacteria bacterium GW2011_GWA2_46_26 TaxID=1618381 RepID=A0A0G1PI29_9BACT|nr:MAG: hypothetical protein UW29_C0012G0010 [Candidatus Collierbacteria bacterium GW2011_GWC2_44_13]KKU32449.1 MAG: hypothetical protein UX47_C0011G0010 [Candidatus Collierbacteria bacterium GW2011_GWA2_46_26]
MTPSPTPSPCYIKSSMTENRKKIVEKLQKHLWFKNTDQSIKDELANLAEDYDPFLVDLADRPDEIGELDVLKMIKLGYGHFMIMPVFEVRSTITNQIFTYEYCSWKTGRKPGMRVLIFLEREGEITHFVLSNSHKFSVAHSVYDAIGGLYLHIFENQIVNLPKKVENEIRFHLGVEKVEFKKIYDLGRCHPDYGMSNNQSDLYAATIDISHLPNLVLKEDFRITHKPVGIEIKIVHISELRDYILNQIEDNYFLSAISRVLVHPDFSLQI